MTREEFVSYGVDYDDPVSETPRYPGDYSEYHQCRTA